MTQHVTKFAMNNEAVYLLIFVLQLSVNDKVVVSRSCSWEDINAPADSCMRTTTPSYIKTEFCETCGHDGMKTHKNQYTRQERNLILHSFTGCNGASKFTGATLLALIPTVIAFVLAL